MLKYHHFNFVLAGTLRVMGLFVHIIIQLFKIIYRSYVDLLGDSDPEYDRNYSPTPPPHSPFTPNES